MVCLITLLVMNVVWYLQHEDTTSPCVHTLSFTVQLTPGLIMQLVCFALLVRMTSYKGCSFNTMYTKKSLLLEQQGLTYKWGGHALFS